MASGDNVGFSVCDNDRNASIIFHYQDNDYEIVPSPFPYAEMILDLFKETQFMQAGYRARLAQTKAYCLFGGRFTLFDSDRFERWLIHADNQNCTVYKMLIVTD